MRKGESPKVKYTSFITRINEYVWSKCEVEISEYKYKKKWNIYNKVLTIYNIQKPIKGLHISKKLYVF